MRRSCWVIASVLLVGMFSAYAPAIAQEEDRVPPDSVSSVENTIEAGESGVAEPKRKLIQWNEYDGPLFTLRAGLALLYEGATFVQNEESKKQFDLAPGTKIRDFRFLLKGRFKSDRSVTWTCGIMYDGATDSWLFRETGIMVAVPELWGHLFLGRTKEGISLNKVMTGYAGWTMERATITDATIPILADGVKWLGYTSQHDFFWNLGYYNDLFSEGQSFSTYDWQFVARFGWIVERSEQERRLLHVGVNGRYGNAYNGNLRLRSRPEAIIAPYFVDTEPFAAHHSRQIGLEAYYRNGPWLFGSEYYIQGVSSTQMNDPVMHGGDIVVSWLITGETREYNTVGGYFKAVSPARTVFEGGGGAWEFVFRLSTIDLDGGLLRGGKFWRLTPMVNWHLSDQIRLEGAYGYGMLDRFDTKGATSFFQFRIQTQI